MNERIKAYALQNAIRYGTAIPGKIVPKVLGEFPEAKKDTRTLLKTITAIVEEVNTMPAGEQMSELERIAPELLEKKGPEKRRLPELRNATRGAVVTRLPPEPSKYNHLGHALTFLINAHYAREYDGRLVLRFEDANPERVSQDFVNMMLEDIQGYLGIHVDEIRYVSDDMQRLLDYTEELIDKGAAYICSCPSETMRSKRRDGVACDCRDADREETRIAWKQFVNGEYREGECVLRFRGEMTSRNTVMRDPVLWRVSTTPHYRAGTKYKAWPLYDLYSPIEEALCGVTHVIRSNEFDLRVELQSRIQELLRLPQPEIVHYGRFNITGATTKGREIREGIEQGRFIGWDDPRLVTLKALRRRGIQRGAYETLAQGLGLSPYPVTLDYSMLAAANREVIEPLANRYTFIYEPVRIRVHGAPEGTVRMHLHPDRKDGRRKFSVNEEFLIRQEDAQSFTEFVRLKDHCTFTVKNKTYTFLSKDHTERRAKIISWLPSDKAQTVPVRIMMPDATYLEGLAEAGIKELEVDDIVQFERFGFCRLDEKGRTYTFWYTHD